MPRRNTDVTQRLLTVVVVLSLLMVAVVVGLAGFAIRDAWQHDRRSVIHEQAHDQGMVTADGPAHATAEALYARVCASRPRNEYGECYPPLQKGDRLQ